MSEVWLIRSTYGSKDEANSAARTLLGERLIACANLSEAASFFIWEGVVTQEEEVVMVMKTTRERVDGAMERIRQLHRYQIPAIVAWPASKCNEAVGAWVEKTLE